MKKSDLFWGFSLLFAIFMLCWFPQHAAQAGLKAVTQSSGGSSYNPAAVAITGGSINNTTIGATTSSTAIFSTVTAGAAQILGGNALLTTLTATNIEGTSGALSGTLTSGTVQATTLLNASALQLNGLESPLPPGGRISLSSTNAVMLSDVTSSGSIYYLPYASQNVPIYNGTHWQEYDVTSSGLSLSMTTTANFPTTKVYDIYATTTGGSPVLCAMYWGSNTLRSTTSGGAGGNQDASLTQKNGIWTNHGSIASSECYNNNTAYTASANQATLLGSFYTNGAGLATWKCQPAGASGGGAPLLGVSNAYNQVTATCSDNDSHTNFTYATGSWEAWNNSTSNEIAYVNTLQNMSPYASMNAIAKTTTISDYCDIAISQGSCSAGTTSTYMSGTADGALAVAVGYYATLGYNYVCPQQYANGGTCTFYDAGGPGMFFNLTMPY